MKNKTKYLIFLSLLLAIGILFYTSIFYNQYPILLGDDGIRHISHAQEIIKTGYPNQVLDPPVFHILIATISLITGQSSATVLTFGVPFILMLVLAAIFMFAKKAFGINIAILACFLVAFVSRQPIQTLEDGSLPSVFTSGFLFIFGLYFLYQALKSNYDVRYISLSSIFFICLILTHHLTFTYFCIFLGLMFIYLLVNSLIKKDFRALLIFLIICAAIAILGFLFALPYYGYAIINSVFKNIFPDIAVGGTNAAQIVLAETDVMPSFARISDLLSNNLLLYLTILGIILCIFFKAKNNKTNDFSAPILFSWLLALIIGASIPITVEHLRYMRDMAIPICILSSIAIILSISIINNIKYKLYVSFAITLLLIIPTAKRVDHIISYNTMQRVQPVDTQAINWIKNNTLKNSKILITPGFGTRGWGDYISLLTDRETVIIQNIKDKKEYLAFNDPDNESSKKYFQENNISYIYAGKEPIGWWPGLEKFPWHNSNLTKASNLDKKTEFNSKFGNVEIFEVLNN